MRKTAFVLLAVAFGLGAGPPVLAVTNLGSSEFAVFEGNDITPDLGGYRILYAPSESDDAGYRARMAAQFGAPCDYYDARFGTPSVTFLRDNYDAVMTWANYAYFDNVAFGNNLADFVDQGGRVVLGAFAAYTSGNFLAGRIMSDPTYCPVAGGFNHFSLSFWDGSDADCQVHNGITSYGCTYRDYLTLDGPGASICGRFQDGEIANAINAGHNVAYANGGGGYPLLPVGEDPERVANGALWCMICGPTFGACCFEDQTCQSLTWYGCTDAGGTWLGAGVPCDRGTCSPTAVKSSTWGDLKNRLRP